MQESTGGVGHVPVCYVAGLLFVVVKKTQKRRHGVGDGGRSFGPHLFGCWWHFLEQTTSRPKHVEDIEVPIVFARPTPWRSLARCSLGREQSTC